MNREQLDSLHEQASERYLEGDFTAARSAWTSLLESAPDDERALEGLRLCEQYEGATRSAPTPETAGEVLEDLDLELDGLVDANPTEVAAGASPGPALDPSIFEDLEDPAAAAADPAQISEVEGLETMLIDHQPDAPAEAARAAVEPPAFGPPSPDRQGEGIDVGAVDEIASLDLDPTLLPDPPAASEGAAQPPPLPEQPAGPDAAQAADQELGLRVQELLHEAGQAVADGRDDDAFAVLARIEILDEGNAAALAMQEEIRNRLDRAAHAIEDAIGEGVQWMESGRLADARERFTELLESAPDHQELLHLVADVDARIAAASEAPEAVPAPDVDDPAAALTLDDDPATASPFDDDPANVELAPSEDDVASLAPAVAAPLARPEGEPAPMPVDDVPVAPPTAAASRTRRPSAVIFGIVAVAVVAAGVWFGTDLFRGPSVGPAVEGGTGAAADAGPAEGKTTAELIEEADRLAAVIADDGATREDSDLAAARLREADEAMARGDWEQAVLAYNDVLEIDPDNAHAAAAFLDAGKAYRERKAQDAEFERALRAFESGDYASGLRVLYRLPADLRPEDVRRAKIAGWYNMGLIELRAGDLTEASRHFREVVSIDENDGLAAEALEFAERYRSMPRDGAYFAEVERMEFRGPDR